MKVRYLTIKGQTRSMTEWSRQPGAAGQTTISWRLNVMGWDPERAVFGKSLRPRDGKGSLEKWARRKPVKFAPSPVLPMPILPTWGGFVSLNWRRAA